jgi:RNA polymerase sigma-70 factor, ECF subfamily
VSSAPSPLAELTRLLNAARGGCQESLGRLLQQCRSYLLVVAHQRLDDDLRATLSDSDLAQEALLRAARGFDGFRGASEAELFGWLRRILLNHLATEAAGQRRRPAVPLADLDPVADGSTPSARLMRQERSEALAGVLAQLSEPHRHVVLLHHRDNLTWAQIGERLGRSADAARMLYGRAVRELAHLLRPADESR